MNRTTPLDIPHGLFYPAWPAMIATVKSDKGQLDLCIPPQPYSARADLFYSTDGTPYTDITLTEPAMAERCSSLLNRAFSPIDIQSVASAEKDFAVTFAKFMGVGTLGTYTNARFTDGATDTFGTKAPLALVYTAPGFQPPAHSLTITSNLGTLKVCVPAIDITQIPKILFVGKNGSTYFDAHLTQLARSCQ